MRHLLLLILLLRVVIPTGMMPDLAGWAAGGPALVICRGGAASQGDGTGSDGVAVVAACPFALAVGQAFIAPSPVAEPGPTGIWQSVVASSGATSILVHPAPLGHRLARGPPAGRMA